MERWKHTDAFKNMRKFQYSLRNELLCFRWNQFNSNNAFSFLPFLYFLYSIELFSIISFFFFPNFKSPTSRMMKVLSIQKFRNNKASALTLSFLCHPCLSHFKLFIVKNSKIGLTSLRFSHRPTVPLLSVMNDLQMCISYFTNSESDDLMNFPISSLRKIREKLWKNHGHIIFNNIKYKQIIPYTFRC